ncbi:MAG: zinc/iron permease [Anaerolineaceae bacterium 4572_5.1]|nr:MAG: zinc/iron permease [Anaerolinea sp. 4484_236]OQY34110.1 MAG: zinc/iron permease [Anaerolineaceae bacterium 4572_5.1]RLD11745.1 MAG: zinc/iron permease [Chloroflexota bacterium]
MFNSPNTSIWLAAFASLAAVVNSIGIFTIFKYKAWAEKAKTYFMCFAAGILISVPLILILPKALEKSFYAGFFALIGFLFMFFSNELISKRTKQKSLAFGIVAVEGIGIHSFIDGIIYAVTFQSSILIGVLAATGMIIHEFAEGVITYLVLRKAGVKEKAAMFQGFLIASLTTPLGALVAYPIIRHLGELQVSFMLGFSAGVLLYVSASHLLPEATSHEKEHSQLTFLLGVGLALLIVLTKLL